MNLVHGEVGKVILGAFYHVYDALGTGFAEKVYENAMVITLRKRGLTVTQQMKIVVYFEGEPVGEFFADLVVAERVVLEFKAVQAIEEAHEAQLLNYLRATRFEVGYVLNFGPKADFKRKIYTNDRKIAPIDEIPF